MSCSDLESFLFGQNRTSLAPVRPALHDLQDGRCFYCFRAMPARVEVDHFIPWARHRDDGIDNLVAACGTCNNAKRDFLPAAPHLEIWSERAVRSGEKLQSIAEACSWPRDRQLSPGSCPQVLA